jgi:methylated-DNA-protein-cysteine methyltransferase-like protein
MARVSNGKLPLTAAVAAAIRMIPRGKVSTYGAVAKAAGYPRCARHVSKVLNQIPGLPWQRVVGSGGRISLPREQGMEQRFMLEAEGVRFKGNRVDLKVFEYPFADARRLRRKKKPAGFASP